MTARPIRVHSLAEARAACAAAAECGVPLLLVSAPAASAHAGALWFQDVVRRAAAEFPNVSLTAVLDCADRAGDAQAALAAGVHAILFTGPVSVAERLADIAAQRGAILLTDRPSALDLRDAGRMEEACRAWLSNGQCPD
jgi:hypothetical protein